MVAKIETQQWVVIGLDTGVFWPTKETKINYRNHEVILRPETDVLAPSIAMQANVGESYDDALLVARRFLSALSWVSNTKVIEDMVSGGGFPIQVGKNHRGGTRHISEQFKLDYIPEPSTSEALLALAFYREAQNVNSPFYSFLGYFKILNVGLEKGADHKQWINDTIEVLGKKYEIQKRVTEIMAVETNIGNYLWESGRCAVAHSYNQPLVNPENSQDLLRIHKDLPVIKTLAEHFIEHELGVKSKHTVWREHLYELEGFRKILGKDIIQALKKKKDVDLDHIPCFPKISIRIRTYKPFDAFEKLGVEVVGLQEGAIALECRSSDNLLVAGLVLDVKNERLLFDGYRGIAVFDDGTDVGAKKALCKLGLLRAWLGNGELEIYETESNTLLGRCDPFLPENIDLGRTFKSLDKMEDAVKEQIDLRLKKKQSN